MDGFISLVFGLAFGSLRRWLVILLLASNSALALDINWNTVTNLTASGQPASLPQIALSSDGTRATAVWRRSNDGLHNIIQSRSATISGNTATWGSVTTNLSASGHAADHSQIALSSDGSMATVAWRRWDGSKYIVQSRSATISGNIATWGAVTANLSASGESAFGPQIALSSDGTRITAVWVRYNGSNHIFQSRSATISGNTATWGSVTDLSAGGESAGYSQFALSSDGTMATAVWVRSDGANHIILSRSATISGNIATWGSVTDLSASGLDARDLQMAVSSDGTRVTAVWGRYDGSNHIIQSRSATISGNTATWGSMTTDLSASGQPADVPQIVLSSEGTRATAVWWRYDGSNYIIKSRSATISGNTATWGSVTTDLSASGQSAFGPQIALSSDGTRATAVWWRYDGSNYIIKSRSATISGNTATWGSVTTDLSASGQSAFGPQIALSSDGTRAMAVWSRGDGPSSIIQSRSATIVSDCSFFVIKTSTGKGVTLCL